MFDIGLGEISVVGIIATLVLGPKECVRLYREFKKILATVRDSVEKELGIFDHEDDEELMDITIDDDGKPQKAYRLDKIMEKIKREVD